VTALCWQLLGKLKEKAVLAGLGEELSSAQVAQQKAVCLYSSQQSLEKRGESTLLCAQVCWGAKLHNV